jgi:hypothetical protein
MTKKKLVEDGFNALDKTWGNASSTPAQIEKANEVFMTDIYPNLNSNERARYRNSLNVYSDGNELKFRALTSPEYDMDSHEAVIDAGNTYLNFTPDTLLSGNDLRDFNNNLLSYTTENGDLYSKLDSAQQAEIRSQEFLRQYGGKIRENAKKYLSEVDKQFVNSDELGRYFNSLPAKQREAALKSYAKAVSFAEGVSKKDPKDEKSEGLLEESLKKRGLSDDFISIAIGNSEEPIITPDPLDPPKKDISEMDEMEQYEEYTKLAKKDFAKLTEKDRADFVVLYSDFGDPAKQTEMRQKQGQQSRKTKKQSYLQSRVDRNMNLYNKYRQLLELGPSQGQGKEATYRAPKGMFVGGMIIKRKELDARMTQLLDAMAKDNTEMANQGMEPDFLDTDL